jgi:hypothetical protein
MPRLKDFRIAAARVGFRFRKRKSSIAARPDDTTIGTASIVGAARYWPGPLRKGKKPEHRRADWDFIHSTRRGGGSWHPDNDAETLR